MKDNTIRGYFENVIKKNNEETKDQYQIRLRKQIKIFLNTPDILSGNKRPIEAYPTKEDLIAWFKAIYMDQNQIDPPKSFIKSLVEQNKKLEAALLAASTQSQQQ